MNNRILDDEFLTRMKDCSSQLYIDENNVVKIKQPAIDDPMVIKLANILQVLILHPHIKWKYGKNGQILLSYDRVNKK